MPVQVRDAGAWKDVDPHVRDAGAWKAVQEIWERAGGVWRVAYSRLKPPVFVGIGPLSSGSGNASPGTPSGILPGDILLAICITSNGTPSAPSGWTTLLAARGHAVFARTVSGASVPTPVFASNSNAFVARCIALRGAKFPIQGLSAARYVDDRGGINVASPDTETSSCFVIQVATVVSTAGAFSSVTGSGEGFSLRSNDQTQVGNGIAAAIGTSVKSEPNSIGAMSARYPNANSNQYGYLTFAVPPAD